MENNFAFIDSQNVHKGIQSLGWFLDWRRFRVYLTDKYKVKMAYLFIGFMPEHNHIYDDLQKAGFVLKFKPVLPNGKDGVKGNVDADSFEMRKFKPTGSSATPDKSNPTGTKKEKV